MYKMTTSKFDNKFRLSAVQKKKKKKNQKFNIFFAAKSEMNLISSKCYCRMAIMFLMDL